MEAGALSVASAIVSILTPYVRAGAEEFFKTAGKDAYEKVKRLWTSLSERWAGDSEASNALAGFATKPDRYRGILQDILGEKIAKAWP